MSGAKAAPPILAGRYEFVRTLGQGGMAVAALARDRVLGREVVLKLPKNLKDKSLHALLVQEALTAASVSYHPCIVTILDVFFDQGVPAIVMEYVADAETARSFAKARLAKRKDALTRTALALYVAYCGAKALQHSHERGVVHRDFKPGNILISGGGAVKLTDFGVAKRAGQPTRLATGKGMGTPLYQAPEQFSGSAASRQTDCYQLGCTLYELLEGEAPHEKAVTDAALLFQKLVLEPPDPKKLRGLGADERSAVLRMYKGLMHRTTSERWAAYQCVECISRILFSKTWVVNFAQKKGPIPKRLADQAFALTNFSCFASGTRAPDGSAVPPVLPLMYNDPQEALEETVALLMAGLGPWVYLTA